MEVAVIIPCHNEEKTIANVVADCALYLPLQSIYVFDNCSTDKTSQVAQKQGAQVIYSPKKGKGNAVRHAFEVVKADIYILVDGDNTYDIHSINKLIELVKHEKVDMVVAARLSSYSEKAFRRFHFLGNLFFSKLVSIIFKNQISDVLSGYRAFSKNFVENVYLQAKEFEIESELTLLAFSRNFSVKEIKLSYKERPEGSFSKLHTYKDGFLILKFIFQLARDYKPLTFFSMVSLCCVLLSLIAGWSPISEYIQFSYVYTVPRAILAGSLMVLSAVLFGVGLILDSQLRLFNQQNFIFKQLRAKNNQAENLLTIKKAS